VIAARKTIRLSPSTMAAVVAPDGEWFNVE
jgi:hypothetical protein